MYRAISLPVLISSVSLSCSSDSEGDEPEPEPEPALPEGDEPEPASPDVTAAGQEAPIDDGDDSQPHERQEDDGGVALDPEQEQGHGEDEHDLSVKAELGMGEADADGGQTDEDGSMPPSSDAPVQEDEPSEQVGDRCSKALICILSGVLT